MEKKNTRDMLLKGNIVSTMISLSIPAMIGMIVIGLYNFMDAMFVGQMVGAKAMTAVKVSYPFTLMNNGIATLIGVGSASVLSRAIGKKDQDTIDKIMGNLIAAVTILSIIMTFIGLVFTRQILTLAGAEGEIMELAVTYLRIVYIGSLFVNFAQAANMVMRGEGILKQAMMIMATGAIINIVLDPIMITMMSHSGNGIKGAAIATLTAQIIQAAITLYFFIAKSNIRIHRIAIDSVILKQVLSVGVSAMLMQVMQMVQQTFMYNIAQQYGGSEYQTILGACLSLQAFAFIPLWGISQGFQPVIGTNFGAKVYKRVGQFTKAFMVFATLVTLIFYIPIMLMPVKMLSCFITDAKIVQLGAPLLQMIFSTYVSYGIMILSITFFQAIGKGGKAALLTLLRQLLLYVPMILILPAIGFGITGLFMAGIITDCVILIISVGLVLGAFGQMRQERKAYGQEA